MPWPSAVETLKHQQDSCTGQAKRMPKKRFHVTFGAHKKLFFWSTSHAIRTPKNCFTLPTEPKKSFRISVENRCKRCLCQAPSKHSNPSRIRGQAKQNACQKNCFTLPLESIKNSNSFGAHATQYARQKTASRCLRNAWKAIESPAPKTVENRCKRCLCQAPPKHSNTSRIRGQAKQNACQKNCFTLPLEPIIYNAFGAQASQDGTHEKV